MLTSLKTLSTIKKALPGITSAQEAVKASLIENHLPKAVFIPSFLLVLLSINLSVFVELGNHQPGISLVGRTASCAFVANEQRKAEGASAANIFVRNSVFI